MSNKIDWNALQGRALTANTSASDLKRELPIAYVLHRHGVEAYDIGGGKLAAVCPFHDDSEPSLDIYGENLDRWGCYPCGIGGDVFDLIGRLTGAQKFPEQAKIAERLIVEKGEESWTPAEVRSVKPDLDLNIANDIVRRASAAEPNAIAAFLMGRSDAVGDLDLDWLRSMFNIGSSGTEQICIPYYDEAGSLVAYKQRTPYTKATAATGSSFDTVLYGIWLDKDKKLPVLLVEGETDTWVAAAALWGEYAVLGLPTGAGAHPKQAHLLKDRAVTIMFDGDRAGRLATLKWAVALRAEDVEVRVVPMPEGHDIASLTNLRGTLAQARTMLPAPDGISLVNNAYVRPGKETNTPLSNWAFDPEVELTGEAGTAYEGRVLPSGEEATISAYDLSSRSRVVAWSLRNGVAWYGSDRDAQQLLGLLQAQGPFLAPGRMATVAGLHHNQFIWPGGTIGPDNWHYVPPPNDVHLDGRIVIPELGEYGKTWSTDQVLVLRSLHSQRVMDPILAWLAVAPLRSLLREFPVLSVTGSSGSGKTTLLETVVKAFTGSLIQSNLTSTTRHALFSFVGCTNAFPVWFDEYRPGARKDTLETLQQVLRDAYTGQASSKGGMGENWAEVNTVPAHAPIIVSGEDAFSETSHTERMVLLGLPIVGRSPDALRQVKEWPENHALPTAYLSWLQYALTYDLLPEIKAVEVPDHGEYAGLPVRQRLNIGTLNLGWELLTQFVREYGNIELGSPDWSLIRDNSQDAAQHNPIKDALLWVLDEVDSLEFIKNDGGMVHIRIENFVEYVNRRSSFVLPGSAAAIRKYLIDHYGATAQKSSFMGKQCRAYVFALERVIQEVD